MARDEHDCEHRSRSASAGTRLGRGMKRRAIASHAPVGTPAAVRLALPLVWAAGVIFAVTAWLLAAYLVYEVIRVVQ